MSMYSRALAGPLMLLAVACFLAALGFLGWQCVQWLRVGLWPEVSVIYALAYAMDASWNTWLGYPQQWIGVHKLLSGTPLALALFVAGAASMMAGAALDT